MEFLYLLAIFENRIDLSANVVIDEKEAYRN